MKTIKSIQWRAEIKALRRVKDEMIKTIEENVEILMISIGDEENKDSPLPNDVE